MAWKQRQLTNLEVQVLGFAVGLLVLGIVHLVAVFKEPQGGLRAFYKLIGGAMAYSGDGSGGSTGFQKAFRVVIVLACWAAAGYLFYDNLR